MRLDKTGAPGNWRMWKNDFLVSPLSVELRLQMPIAVKRLTQLYIKLENNFYILAREGNFPA